MRVGPCCRCSNDADGDGIPDDEDQFPDDPDESADSDGDGVGDNADNCVDLENPSQDDLDGDGQGDDCDVDRDGDKVVDEDDDFPDDPSETVDSDGDGYGDNIDELPQDPEEWLDGDGDGAGDNSDNCDGLSNPDQADLDVDGLGDACDDDRDGDGVADTDDLFPDDSTDWADSDGDGVGDNADAFPEDATEQTDGDLDGTGDNSDNCPDKNNPDQADLDDDELGDVCDDDADGDGDVNVVLGGADCDDLNADVNSSATETWYDGVDGDCSGGSDFDQDGDGVDAYAEGGTDCDDQDEDIVGCGASASEAWPGGCKDLKDAAPDLASGSFWLDLDGFDGAKAPVELTCDMTTAGGGWVVLTPCDFVDKLDAQVTVIRDLGLTFDSECRPSATETTGSDYKWIGTYAPGYSEIMPVGYAMRSYDGAGGTHSSDLGALVQTDWSTFMNQSRGDVVFGSPDEAPVGDWHTELGTTSFATPDQQVIDWPRDGEILTLSAPSTSFGFGWAESGGQIEGWYPWWEGTMLLR